MTVKLLIEQHLEFLSFKGVCTGLSDSTLLKIPHCLKSHVMAYIILHYIHQHSIFDCSVANQQLFSCMQFYIGIISNNAKIKA